MRRTEIGSYLVIDPEVSHGQMTLRGTRVPVETLLAFLAKGYSVDQLLRSWPELARPTVEEAISLASESLQARYGVPQEESLRWQTYVLPPKIWNASPVS